MLVIGQAAVAAVFAATVWAAGALVSGVLWRVRRDPMQRDAVHSNAVQRDLVQCDGTVSYEAPMPWALTMALGFAVIGQLLTLAGLAGMLRKPVVIVIAIGIHAAAIPVWRRLLDARIGSLWPWSWRAGALGVGGSAAVIAQPAFLLTAIRLTIAALTIGLLTAFLLTLYPPIGFDQTMYHLPFARAFAASGGLPFLPTLRYPMFPPLAEVLNAAVLMFAGDVATQAAGWVALVACVGLSYTWASDLASDGVSRPGETAWLSGRRLVSKDRADAPSDVAGDTTAAATRTRCARSANGAILELPRRECRSR